MVSIERPTGLLVVTVTLLLIASASSANATVPAPILIDTLSFYPGAPWPTCVQLDPEEEFIYVPCHNHYNGKIFKIDLATMEVVDSASVGCTPDNIAMASDGERIVITNTADWHSSTVLTTSPFAVECTVPGIYYGGGVDIVPETNIAYIGSQWSPLLQVVDINECTVLSTMSDFGFGLLYVAITPDGTQAYVCGNSTGNNPGRLFRVDTELNQVIDTIDVSGRGIAFTPDGSETWVTSWRWSDNVYILETASGLVLDSIQVADTLVDIQITSNGEYAFVSSYDDMSISVLSVDDREVIAIYDIGHKPNRMQFASGDTVLYVNCFWDDIILKMSINYQDLGGEQVWCDDFEGYSPGSSVGSEWALSGNISSVADGSIAYTGDQSLKMFGQIGQCWAAVADKPLETTFPMTVEFAIRNGTENLYGCHPYRGGVGLRSGPHWTDPGSTGILAFLENGDLLITSTLPYVTLSGFSLEHWYQFKVDISIPGDGFVHTRYWVDGAFLGEYTRDTTGMAYLWDAKYLDLSAQEGTAWFDDVCVGPSSESPHVPICHAFLTPKRLAIHDTRVFRAAPRNSDVRGRRSHSFKIHLLPCDLMDVSVGDSAEVFVDVDASGEFDNDEQYPAVVSSTDRDGEATDIAIKVFVGEDLIDNDPLVAIWSVGGHAIVDADGNPIDYLQLDTFTPGRGGMAAGEGLVPMNFMLDQNYPNPFNANTAIRFALPTPSDWTLRVYNVAGQLIEEFRGSAESGYVTVNWDAVEAASGIYFYKLIAGDFTETRKMILMK